MESNNYMYRLKIGNLILFAFILLIFSCKQSEQMNSWAYKEGPKKYTVFPKEFLGINFCKLQFVDIINEFKTKNLEFEYFDNDAKSFIKYESDKIKIDQTEDVKAVYFIGSELDKSKILEVIYTDPYREGWLHLQIKFKEEYYDILLELIGNKLGKENSNYNRLNYNEISWDADPDHAVPTCISNIIISKKQRYEKSEKGVCYLKIITRSRDSHVH